MRSTDLSREGFINWLAEQSGGAVSPQVPLEHIRSRSSVTLFWPSGEKDAPIIAVDGDEMRDFLAFVATYVGTYVPFTAFFRVVPRPFIDVLPTRRRELQTDQIESLLGIVICDAALQLGGNSIKVSDISVQSCIASPSTVAVTAATLGYDGDLIEVALQRWFNIRDELAKNAPRVNAEQLLGFWNTVIASFDLPRMPYTHKGGVRREVLEFIRAAVTDRDGVGEYEWRQLSLVPGHTIRELPRMMRSNREDRVRMLDQLIDALPPGSHAPASDMAIGYITSQVAEGSLNYLSLVTRLSQRFPIAALWFGFFCGINRNNDILIAGDCLGRRLLRRVQPSGEGIGTTRADFSYEEFIMYAQEGRISRVRLDNSSVADVELIPGVYGRYGLAKHGARSDDLHKSSATIENARKLVNQLQNVLREEEVEYRGENRDLFASNEKGPTAKSRSLPRRK